MNKRIGTGGGVRLRGRVGLLVALGALGGGLYGYAGSVLSGALITMRFGGHLLDSGDQGILTAALLLGIAVGAGVAGRLSDTFGAHRIILIGALLTVPGTVGCAFASGLAVFVMFRALIGLGLGFTSCIIPLYLGEMAPPAYRGRIVSVNSVAMVVGQLLSVLIDAILNIVADWRAMLWAVAVPAVLLLIVSTLIRATPRFWQTRGDNDCAIHELAAIEGVDVSSIRLEPLSDSSHEETSFTGARWLRRVLIVGIALAVMNQLTGQNMINYYAPTIFSRTLGFDDSNSVIVSVPVIFVSAVAAVVGGILVIDKVDRRVMLIGGLAGTVLFLTLIGVSYLFIDASPAASWLLIVLMMVYLVFVQGMVAPVTWLLIAEIFPASMKARGAGYANIAMNLTNFVVSLAFPSVLEMCGGTVTFWMFAVVNFVCLVFAHRFVPETRGKSFVQIEQEWRFSVPEQSND